MAQGGWARLKKEQQQESTPSHLSNDSEYQVHKYKNIIGSTETTLGTPCTATSSPLSIRGYVDQGDIRANKLLQILRRWKSQTSAKHITPRPHRSATTGPNSCSRLNFVPLSCLSFSSIQLYSDTEEEEEEEQAEVEDTADGHDVDFAAESSHSKNATIPPILHPRASSPSWVARLSPRQNMKSTRQSCTSKGRDSSCERKVWEQATGARRTVSCPKLSSPLRSCAAFRGMGDEEGEEGELERLKAKEEEGGSRGKLRRSSSSPIRRQGHSISKQPCTPKGYLALYVGEERRRFVVKATLLNHPFFSVLLEKARDEFGFAQKGALNIPCDIAFFQQILFLAQSNQYPSSKHAHQPLPSSPASSPNLAAATLQLNFR